MFWCAGWIALIENPRLTAQANSWGGRLECVHFRMYLHPERAQAPLRMGGRRDLHELHGALGGSQVDQLYQTLWVLQLQGPPATIV